MPDTDNKTDNKTAQTTPPPADDAQYVTLARPQASALFSEQRVEFKGDEVLRVIAKRELGEDAGKTILADAAKELIAAGRIVYCTKNGKPLTDEKDDKKETK